MKAEYIFICIVCITARSFTMHNLIHYKEHYGRISYSANNKEFTGSVAGEKTSSNVSLKGSSEEEVKKAFKDYIDEMMNTGKNKKS